MSTEVILWFVVGFCLVPLAVKILNRRKNKDK
jgi:hypothetical protein